jgi:hypothetical protein
MVTQYTIRKGVECYISTIGYLQFIKIGILTVNTLCIPTLLSTRLSSLPMLTCQMHALQILSWEKPSFLSSLDSISTDHEQICMGPLYATYVIHSSKKCFISWEWNNSIFKMQSLLPINKLTVLLATVPFTFDENSCICDTTSEQNYSQQLAK